MAAGAYTFHRGLRIPPFQLEPSNPVANSLRLDDLVIHSDQFLLRSGNSLHSGNDSNISHWRALAPQGSLAIYSPRKTEIALTLSNLSKRAQLSVQNADYQQFGQASQQVVKLAIEAQQTARLEWRWPAQPAYKFAAIGDSGGDQEMAWCIERAVQLEADFLLHLGDFNYQAGDYQRAVELFNNAPLPVYVSIGNHDFHDQGAVYQPFLDEIGPLNSFFDLGDCRFLNVDTAAGFWPLSGGQRGQLFADVSAMPAKKTIAYTHCPLIDPDPQSDHDVGSERERRWLADQLNAVGADMLLSGHIHIKDRRSVMGLEQIIVGQGLGHQDLIVGQDHSKMLIGEVSSDGELTTELADLAMPMELHCHPRTNPVKQSLKGGEREALLQRVDQACKA